MSYHRQCQRPGAVSGLINPSLPPIPTPRPGEFSFEMLSAWRYQYRAVTAYWGLLERYLADRGYIVLLDRIEHEPDCGWSIYYTGVDPRLVETLHEQAAGEQLPGSYSGFYADDRIRDWLIRIERRLQRTGTGKWAGG